jgi:SAM-dependent methyltransferase
MRGYDPTSYGQAMADVYDDWYSDPSDTAACVAALTALAGSSAVLELGAGTGRLAIPLAGVGLEVHALDASPAMLDALRAKAGGQAVHCHLGDLAGPLPGGPFGLVFVAVNTFFSLLTQAAQQQALAAVAAVLGPGGRLVIEAFVPDVDADGDRVEVRDLAADRVVLSVSRAHADEQSAMGQFIELRDGQPVRLRPWAIRWATPDQLDAMAAAAGLVLAHRWGSWHGEAFGPQSSHHISTYRRHTDRAVNP